MYAEFHQFTTCAEGKEEDFQQRNRRFRLQASVLHESQKMNLSKGNSVFRHDFIQQTLCDRTQSSQTQTNAALAISSLYIPLAIAILLGNSVILIALKKERSLYPPSKLLLFNLVSTDLGIGSIVLPLCILYFMSIAYKRWEICRLTEMFSYMATFILCGVSLLTVTAISVDRLLALLKRMRYRQIVTVKRVHILLLMFWIESVCTSFTFVWSVDIFYVVSAILIFLCLTVSTFCYVKILLFLASRQSNMRGYPDQANNAKSATLNIRRYKKSLSTALWIHFTLIICFLPLVIIISCNNFLSVKRTVPVLLILDMAKATLCYLNSLLNPILYCWKIREIRQVVKKILQKTSC